MLEHDKGLSTEPASLGSDAPHRHRFTAVIALLTATLMTIAGIGSWVAAASASEDVTGMEAKVESRELVGMPVGMKVRALLSMKNEETHQIRLNRAAKKKHELRVVRYKIIKTAKAQIGDPYRLGQSGPNAFDCSGFVRFVYKKVTGKNLPHHSRSQYHQARKIKKKNAQPGDLVFFFRNGAHHVGIYLGNGKMVDAPNSGNRVRVSPISGSWWGRSYTGMGRILPA
jgi:hypothetical protein